MKTEKDELKEKMKDMGFVEKVMKPLMNEYYMEQGKNTKGELIVMVAKQDMQIEKLKAENKKLIAETEMLNAELLILEKPVEQRGYDKGLADVVKEIKVHSRKGVRHYEDSWDIRPSMLIEEIQKLRKGT